MTSTLTEPVALGGDVSNAGAETISASLPYRVAVTVTGTADILWHRWQSDAIEAKAKASKGSAAKKSDDVESYVYRDGAGTICLPGEYLRGSLVDPRNGAAKYMQDPRSPRKSALDLFKAAVVPLTALAPIIRADGEPATAWAYIDRRRVTVQRAGFTCERPALRTGWRATVLLLINTPEYLPPELLLSALNLAGRLVGVADYRPTYGRFSVSGFELLD